MDEQDTTVTHPQDLDSSEPEDEEQYFIRIDRRRLPEELSRLEKQDKEFGNLLHARVGSRAADRYQPQLRQRDLELQELRQQLRWKELESMSGERVEELYEKDKGFAREWTEFVHRNPEAFNERREAMLILERTNSILSRAVAAGLSEEVLDKYKASLQRGEYDRDEDGQPNAHWSDGLQRLREDLAQEITDRRGQSSRLGEDESDEDEEVEEPTQSRQVRSGSARRPASQESSSANPALVRGGPDTTPSSRGSIARRVRYRTQVEAASAYNAGRITSAEYREAQRTLPYQ